MEMKNFGSNNNTLKFETMGRFHTEEAEKVARHYGSSVELGLSDEVAANRLRHDGPNIVKTRGERPLWIKFFLSFLAGFAPVLWVCVILAFVAWSIMTWRVSESSTLAMAIILLIIIVVSSLFKFWQELHSAMVMRGFGKLLPPTCRAIRGGITKDIPTSDLVVGDVVLLTTGSKIPADMRVAYSRGMKIDKSMLTGETEQMTVSSAPMPTDCPVLEANNTVFMGCSVESGDGVGIVVATGSVNQLYKIVAMTEGRRPKTPIQHEFDRVVIAVSSLTLAVVIVAIIFWSTYLRNKRLGLSYRDLLMYLISIIVAFIPLGFPLATHLGLMIIARRLCVTHNVLIKRLGVKDLLASATLLAVDKTGTLTQNLMTATGIISSADVITNTERESKSNDNMESESKSTDNMDTIAPSESINTSSFHIAALCNEAKLIREPDTTVGNRPSNSVLTSADRDLENGETVYIATGSRATDRGLLNWVHSHADVLNIVSDFETQTMIPFSSRTKMCVCVTRHQGTRAAYVLVKGAPENVLPRCKTYMDVTGDTVPMSASFLSDLDDRIAEEAGKGCRIIALAQLGPLPMEEYPDDYMFRVNPVPNFPTTDLTFVSCVALSDPPREGVTETIQQLRDAQIQVVMITGDATATASAIAKQVGVISAGSSVHTLHTLHRKFGVALESDNQAIVVNGDEMTKMTELEWDYVFSHRDLVFARISPEQKLEIVTHCQQRGHFVGVTGDGVNDAQALRKANVGIAMNSGAEVARDVADIVLLTDDFRTLMVAVSEGRLVFDNIKKVVVYLMSISCWSVVLPVLASFFLGMPTPTSVFYMLLIKCVTGVFAGLSLIYEPATADMMTRPPRDIRNERLLDYKVVLYSYMFMGNLVAIGAFYNYFAYFESHKVLRESGNLLFAWDIRKYDDQEYREARWTAVAVYFNALVIAQIAHLISIRTKLPYFSHLILGNRDANLRQYCDTLRESILGFHWPILFVSVGCVITILFFMRIEWFNYVFGTAPVSGKYWGMAIGWACLWFFLDEIRKWVVLLYPRSWVGQLAW